MIFDMLDYREQLRKQNINIIYSGPIWAEGIESLGDTIRKRLEHDDAPFSVSQAVFSVFIEEMNNMLMYSAEKECFAETDNNNREVPTGLFVMGMQGGTYFIHSGNTIKAESVRLLKSRIDYLNTLNKEGLRQFYKDQIKNSNKNPESKGAGLGLIEIAKRASCPIEYSFTPLQDGLVFYSIFVRVNQGGH